ncbi:Retrotransposon [Abeliophyllum distichum]|uniref:Retrotransposon n=1 Tax=Abeliophyllum distichum TaxID=126358 RepID=A0ABD1SBH8_9LAMI
MTLAQMFSHMEHTSVQVVELFDDTGWDIHRLLLVLPYYMAVQVESLLLCPNVLDRPMWKDTSDGFSAIGCDYSEEDSRPHGIAGVSAVQRLKPSSTSLLIAPVAHQVWPHFSAIFGIPLKVGEMLQHRFQTWKFSGQFVKGGHIRTIILLLVLWFIWTAR